MKDFFSKELRLGCALAPIVIPIGVVIVYVGMGLLMGDFGAAFGLLALSIICTAGISLIFWIPLWYVVGYSVLMVLRVILSSFGVDIGAIFGSKKTKPAPDSSQPARPTLSRDQLALLKYIKKARAKGLSDQQISQNLANNGWSNDSITAGFQMA